jgi:hypothetical protein
VEEESELSVKINTASPNPFVKEFEVSYMVPKEGTAKVKIVNLKGEVIHEEDVACEKQKEQHFKFKDDNQMKPGVYFFQVAQENDKRQVKLIKRL